jgi:glycosyltransferase involved in cell wall biosynthesis
MLAESGCEVRALGVMIPGTEALRLSEHPRIRADYLPQARGRVGQRVQFLVFAAWVARTVLTWRPQWLYASELLAAPVALALSYLPWLRVVFHEHDAPAPRGGTMTVRLCIAARNRLVRRAAIVVTPNADRSAALARATGRSDVLTVWNAPRAAEVRPPRRVREGPLRVLYQGSIVPDRLPPTVIDALVDSPAVELLVVGYETAGHTGYVEALRARAREVGVETRVTFRGPMPHAALLERVTATCDVGLALAPAHARDVNLRTLTGASVKAFEYLACGLALIVSDVPDWRAMFAEPGMALAVADDAAALAAAFRWCEAHRAEVVAMGERGRRAILDRWNYEAQFAPVAAAMLGAHAEAHQAAPPPEASRAEVTT